MRVLLVRDVPRQLAERAREKYGAEHVLIRGSADDAAQAVTEPERIVEQSATE